MKQTFTLKERIAQLAVVLIPILITQVGLFGMNFFDTIMSGHASAVDLAGVAIGSSLWVPILTGINGILMALTPIVSQYLGANKKEKVPFTVIQSVYLAIFISLLIIVVGFFILDPILALMDLEQNVRFIAKGYLIALAFGIIPLFVSNVLRLFMDALGYTRITMMITLIALPINIVFNYVLIFGKLGFPKLGGIGAGYATAITYWLILFISIYFVAKVKPFKQYAIFAKLFPLSFAKWKELLVLGIPIGFTIFFETGIFSAVTLLMSQFDTSTIAAHQAAMNFATLIYMVPLSVSMALTIVVGYEVGAKRIADAKQYATIGVSSAVIFAVIAAIVLFVSREMVASFYTKEMEVAYLIGQFLIYAIFFQLSDALATPIQGVLRGHKDVNISFFAALISYWIIGLPTGFIMANYTSFGPYGYWLGLVTGLAIGAAVLSIRLIFVQKKAEQEIKKRGELVG